MEAGGGCSSGEPGSLPGDEPLQLSAESCLEQLSRAKLRGADGHRDRERLYGLMSDHYLQVLRSPALYGRLSAAERELILARRMEGAPVLAVAETGEQPEPGGGGGSPEPAPEPGGRRLLCLHPERRRWEELSRLPDEVPASGSGMCTLFNYLFVAGGLRAEDGGRPAASDRVFCFNPRTGAWSRVRPLGQPRCQPRLVAMDGLLYAVGGECLFSVERYDPRADRWSPVAPLPRGSFAAAAGATSCGGELFVSGGSLLYRLLRYDSRRDEWEECPFNESRRRPADLLAHRGLLYRFDVDRQRAAVSLHRYSPVVKAWLRGASFPLRCPQSFRCAALGDRIYCVGRSRTLQFQLRDDTDEPRGFLPEELPSPPGATGALVPFILTLRPGTGEPGPDTVRHSETN